MDLTWGRFVDAAITIWASLMLYELVSVNRNIGVLMQQLRLIGDAVDSTRESSRDVVVMLKAVDKTLSERP